MEVINNLCQATQRILGSCFRSTLNRHLSADTIVPNPANPQSFNRYSYVENNPINRTDPTGHVPCGLLGDIDDVSGCISQLPQPVESLPESYVRIYAGTTPTGAGRGRANGVIVAPNAILTHNHFYNETITPDTIESITLFPAAPGASLTRASSGEFTIISGIELGGMDNGLILIVFKEDFASANEVAVMAQAGSWLNGRDALQAARIGGGRDGMYATEVIDGNASFSRQDGTRFNGIQVSPDYTIPGDSGGPLFVNGSVVGLNNQGNGQFGAITNLPLIQSLITDATETLWGEKSNAR